MAGLSWSRAAIVACVAGMLPPSLARAVLPIATATEEKAKEERSPVKELEESFDKIANTLDSALSSIQSEVTTPQAAVNGKIPKSISAALNQAKDASTQLKSFCKAMRAPRDPSGLAPEAAPAGLSSSDSKVRAEAKMELSRLIEAKRDYIETLEEYAELCEKISGKITGFRSSHAEIARALLKVDKAFPIFKGWKDANVGQNIGSELGRCTAPTSPGALIKTKRSEIARLESYIATKKT